MWKIPRKSRWVYLKKIRFKFLIGVFVCILGIYVTINTISPFRLIGDAEISQNMEESEFWKRVWEGRHTNPDIRVFQDTSNIDETLSCVYRVRLENKWSIRISDIQIQMAVKSGDIAEVLPVKGVWPGIDPNESQMYVCSLLISTGENESYERSMWIRYTIFKIPFWSYLQVALKK